MQKNSGEQLIRHPAASRVLLAWWLFGQAEAHGQRGEDTNLQGCRKGSSTCWGNMPGTNGRDFKILQSRVHNLNIGMSADRFKLV